MTVTLDAGQKPRKNGARAPSVVDGSLPDIEALQELLDALTAATEGNFSVRLPARAGR